jgi:hypothetical protein
MGFGEILVRDRGQFGDIPADELAVRILVQDLFGG